MVSIRSVPGCGRIQIGKSIFSLGNKRCTRKGGGGSGEPTTVEVVRGVYFSIPCRGSSARATEASKQPARVSRKCMRMNHETDERHETNQLYLFRVFRLFGG